MQLKWIIFQFCCMGEPTDLAQTIQNLTNDAMYQANLEN